jgi:integrase
MTMANFTVSDRESKELAPKNDTGKNASKKPEKPVKPYPEFPLTAHSSGQWCKSIRGKLKYFGPWARMKKGKWERVTRDGWQKALDRFNSESEALYRNRKPRPRADTLTVADLCNAFRSAKEDLLLNGELSPRTYQDYVRITDRLVRFFGKNTLIDDLAADDFEALRKDVAKTCGFVRLGGEIRQSRMVFKYGFDNSLLDRPVRFGSGFKPPKAAVLRKHRNERGSKMFGPAEIRALINAAGPQLKAMILLGINCGFGNSDCGTLPLSRVDLDQGWHNYPRPKTGVQRRCPLWPETVEALRVAIAERPTPKNDADADLLFVSRLGNRWAKDTSASPITAEFCKLLNRPRCPKCGKIEAADAEQCGGCEWKPVKGEKWAKLHRTGVNFYALRHTFETIGGESRDQVAVDHVMGHTPPANDMSAVYRERISDERLRAVVDHVHAWLFGDGQGGQAHE